MIPPGCPPRCPLPPTLSPRFGPRTRPERPRRPVHGQHKTPSLTYLIASALSLRLLSVFCVLSWRGFDRLFVLGGCLFYFWRGPQYRRPFCGRNSTNQDLTGFHGIIPKTIRVSWFSSNSRFQTVAAARVRPLLVFVFHQFIGTWGIAFLAAFGLFSLLDVLPSFVNQKPFLRFVHWVLTGNPFYPVQIVVGLYFGWLLGRRFHHRSMVWIWILPLAILIYSFATTPVLSPWESLLSRPTTVQSRLSYYFGWGCQTRARCLNQLVITMPFYASVAYSVGALLARNRFTKDQRTSGTQTMPVTP